MGQAPTQTETFATARKRMVETQIVARGISDERLLAALREVPREAFVPERLADCAHGDTPLPIGEYQTISQPYIVALMMEAAKLCPSDSVLEVGAGSGYAAAAMSRIVAEVFAIERHGALAGEAAARLAELGYTNVTVRAGDGTLGWPEAAPFDAILVSASGPKVPEALLAQLAFGGRLVMPVGSACGGQRLVRCIRRGAAELSQDDLGAVSFVPLVGAQGWKER